MAGESGKTRRTSKCCPADESHEEDNRRLSADHKRLSADHKRLSTDHKRTYPNHHGQIQRLRTLRAESTRLRDSTYLLGEREGYRNRANRKRSRSSEEAASRVEADHLAKEHGSR